MHTSLSIPISLLVGGCRFRMTVWVQTTVTQLQCAIVCCPTQPLHKTLILVQPKNQPTEGIHVKKGVEIGLIAFWHVVLAFLPLVSRVCHVDFGWATLIARLDLHLRHAANQQSGYAWHYKWLLAACLLIYVALHHGFLQTFGLNCLNGSLVNQGFFPQLWNSRCMRYVETTIQI